MSAKRVRLGFVGAGSHATQALYPCLPMIPECRLAAVCDLDLGKAERIAQAYGATPFASLDAMLGAVEVDAVCACGSPQMMHEVGMQVLERGLPLWIEKPPAPTLRQAQELADAATSAGTFGMVGFMKRFAPANAIVRELVQSESFGGLSSITVIHGSGPYQDARRMLLFNGIHPLDLMRFLAGDVRALVGHVSSSPAGVQVVSAAMRFSSGALGQLNMNSGATWTDCYEYAYLSGSEAQVIIDAGREAEVRWPHGRFASGEGFVLYGWANRYQVSHNQADWHASGHYTRGYQGELRHFVRAVLGDVEPQATLEDGVEAMRLIEAILISAAEGQEIQVAEVLS